MFPSHQKRIGIVGGGVAGLTIARFLSAFGLRSIIIENQSALGGHVRNWACMATQRCLRCYSCTVADLVAAVTASPLVHALLKTELAEISTEKGAVRQVTVRHIESGKTQSFDVSALVLAAGFQPYDPSDKGFWGYGQLTESVLTLQDMYRMVKDDELNGFSRGVEGPMRVAFFQCVGSRDRSIGANYCSHYCCKAALRMALRIAHEKPDWRLSIFYVDLQVTGKFGSQLLKEAQSRGIRLIQGVPGEIVPQSDGMVVVVREENGRNIREPYHRIVLSIGQRPAATLPRLAAICGLELDRFGYGASPRSLCNGRTDIQGLYLAGSCVGPMDIEETLLHAGQTAAAVVQDLMRKREDSV